MTMGYASDEKSENSKSSGSGQRDAETLAGVSHDLHEDLQEVHGVGPVSPVIDAQPRA
jgi:hypothetical protein